MTTSRLFAFLIWTNIFFLGCMKKPDLKPDYGPEVAINQIQNAVSESSFSDPTLIYKDQYVSLDQIQVIDTQMPMTVYQRLDQVTNRLEDSSYYYLSFHVHQNELESGGTFKESQQDYNNLVLAKPENSQTQTVEINKAPVASEAITKSEAHISGLISGLNNDQVVTKQIYQPASVKAIKKMDNSSTVRITYHNLSKTTATIPVPSIVRQKPNCGGVKECDKGLRLYIVSFDRVVWNADDHGIKTNYRFTYSPDIPTYVHDWDDMGGLYFTNQYETCMQTWLEVTQQSQTQVVPVRQCIGVSDFKFGTVTPP